MYGLQLVTGPSEEPVSLAELKAWLRIEHTADDTLISALGAAARGLLERLFGRQLVTATWRLTMDGFPWPNGWQLIESPIIWPDPHTIRIPRAPLQSVTSITYYDLGDNLLTLAASTYDVDTIHDPGRVNLAMNKVWPVTRLKPGAVRVLFAAGYGAASAVPEEIKTAIKLTVAQWYEHRGEDGSTQDLPPAAKALLQSCWNGELEYGT